VEDLIEIITEQSSAPGERHERLRRYVGEIALRVWRGEPGNRKHDVGGCAWTRAQEWMPYQRRTFVSPAFPGANQAGQSRVWGGIHVLSDDFDRRRVGNAVGTSMLALVTSYFDGSAVP
jgi:hypothetical protein